MAIENNARIVAWYTDILHNTVYGRAAARTKGGFFRPKSSFYDNAMNCFSTDLYSLFSLYNVMPSLGHPVKMALILQVYMFPVGYKSCYDVLPNSFDISNQIGIQRFSIEMNRKWATTFAVLNAPLLFGTYAGQYLKFDQIKAHENAYVIDTENKTYEIFDINGDNQSSTFIVIRNTMAMALEQFGLHPFNAKLPYVSKIQDIAEHHIAEMVEEKGNDMAKRHTALMLISTPGMILRNAIRHPALCVLWSVSFLWLRATNTAKNLGLLFTSAQFISESEKYKFSLFIKNTYDCIHDLFQVCIEREEERREQQMDMGDDIVDNPLAFLQALVDNGDLLDLRLPNFQPPLRAILRIVFTCFIPTQTLSVLRDCSQGDDEKWVEQFMRYSGVNLPWKAQLRRRPTKNVLSEFFLSKK